MSAGSKTRGRRWGAGAREPERGDRIEGILPAPRIGPAGGGMAAGRGRRRGERRGRDRSE